MISSDITMSRIKGSHGAARAIEVAREVRDAKARCFKPGQSPKQIGFRAAVASSILPSQWPTLISKFRSIHFFHSYRSTVAIVPIDKTNMRSNVEHEVGHGMSL